MFISKRIMGIILGACVALLIVAGATSSPGATAITVDQSELMVNETIDEASACGKCGDNYCNPRCGETATSCPRDCGGGGETSVAATACGKCGDGYCNPRCGETATSCAKDCGTAS